MDDYINQFFEDSGHFVTPEEAVQGLISAVVLRGVLDYRDVLLNNVALDDYGDYYICPTNTIQELETFFENIGFSLYRSLPDKIVEFKQQMDRLTKEDFEPDKEKSYICPICGGMVNCRRVKLPPKHSHNGKKPYEDRVYCRGCLMRATVF